MVLAHNSADFTSRRNSAMVWQDDERRNMAALKIINLHGKQAVDPWAFVAGDIRPLQ